MRPDQSGSGRPRSLPRVGFAVGLTLIAIAVAAGILAFGIRPRNVKPAATAAERSSQLPHGIGQVAVATNAQTTNTNPALQNFAATMFKALDRATNFEAAGLVLESTGDQSIDALMRLFLQFTDWWREAFSDLATGLETAGEPDIFSPEVLAEHIKLRQALDTQLVRRELIERQRMLLAGEIQWITDSVRATQVTGPHAKRILSLINDGIIAWRAAAEDRFEACSQYENAKERFLRFALEAFPNYSLSEGEISFAWQTDLQQYVILTSDVGACHQAVAEHESRALGRFETYKTQIQRFANQ